MSEVACIDCKAVQTHRVCAECFADQTEAAVCWTRRVGSSPLWSPADLDAEEARIRAIPHDEYLP